MSEVDIEKQKELVEKAGEYLRRIERAKESLSVAPDDMRDYCDRYLNELIKKYNDTIYQLSYYKIPHTDKKYLQF